MSEVRIGISGWRYDGWRGTLYPPGLAQKRELEFASRAVQTIEINGTHYGLQSPAAFRHWHDETPDAFVFSVKGARYLTHMLRFRDESANVACANFFAQGLLALNAKLGPILWQFPPNYRFHADRLERFLALLPHDTEAARRLAARHDARVIEPWIEIDRNRPMRHAIEIRHASFVAPAFVDLLRRYRVALVVSDSTEPWPYAEDATADFAYVRLHGSAAKYAGAYSDAALDQWHARLKAWSEGKPSADARLIAPQPRARERKPRDVYCYFDNDQKTEAPFDARRLMTRFGFAEEPLRRDAQAI
ncbi:DUF72 domain-containing protein [Paraburkholderia mimosarum]|uniref:DUF72 domain-containing protein n=1 Tax=Paraburkholderia mimosarum TaxID=312026 RepID=UPI00040CB0D6|nr:DUF72 domain-containing protein [Paraburkholderia mimosarum]